MSRFFVGQRVRVVRPDRDSVIRGLVAGDEGVISRYGFYVDACVEVTGKKNKSPGIGELDTFPVWFRELEPILPTAVHQPAELTVHELLPFLKEQVTA